MDSSFPKQFFDFYRDESISSDLLRSSDPSIQSLRRLMQKEEKSRLCSSSLGGRVHRPCSSFSLVGDGGQIDSSGRRSTSSVEKFAIDDDLRRAIDRRRIRRGEDQLEFHCRSSLFVGWREGTADERHRLVEFEHDGEDDPTSVEGSVSTEDPFGRFVVEERRGGTPSSSRRSARLFGSSMDDHRLTFRLCSPSLRSSNSELVSLSLSFSSFQSNRSAYLCAQRYFSLVHQQLDQMFVRLLDHDGVNDEESDASLFSPFVFEGNSATNN